MNMILKHWLRLCTVGAVAIACGAHYVVYAAESESAPQNLDNYANRPEVRLFIKEMHDKHGFDIATLEKEFSQVKTIDSVLRSIARPAEKSLTWPAYQRILIDRKRIVSGASFAQIHRKTLQRAESDYAVPAEVILAILGVETRYGTTQGKHKVFHSLSTLAFGYPRRASFFRKQLEALLLLAREQKFDLHTLTGSYAGAMGYGQFIPSSYRSYAIDYDGDDIKDLLTNPVDAIGSIANYLHKNGWRAGVPVAALARTKKNPQLEIVNQGRRPRYTLEELDAKGFVLQVGDIGEHKAMVLSFDLPEKKEYWFAFGNFSALMSYNPSYFYAMAVHQLSQEIETHID